MAVVFTEEQARRIVKTVLASERRKQSQINGRRRRAPRVSGGSPATFAVRFKLAEELIPGQDARATITEYDGEEWIPIEEEDDDDDSAEEGEEGEGGSEGGGEGEGEGEDDEFRVVDGGILPSDKKAPEGAVGVALRVRGNTWTVIVLNCGQLEDYVAPEEPEGEGEGQA